MAFCAQCGQPVDGAFCGVCGTPTASAPTPPPAPYPNRPTRSTTWVPAVVLTVLVLAIATVGFLVLRPKLFGSDVTDAQPAAPPLATTPAAAPPPPVATGTEPTSPVSPSSGAPSSTSPTSHVDPRDLAEQQLKALYHQDASRFSADGQWIAQLSSKCEGITDPHDTTSDGGHTFYDQDILPEVRQLQTDFGDDVLLVKSTDFGTQVAVSCTGQDQTLWTTIYDPGTFDSEADVTAWCDENFGDKSPISDFCFPRQATQPHD